MLQRGSPRTLLHLLGVSQAPAVTHAEREKRLGPGGCRPFCPPMATVWPHQSHGRQGYFKVRPRFLSHRGLPGSHLISTDTISKHTAAAAAWEGGKTPPQQY